MTKKRILILMKTMNIGGAERSLLGLLNTFDYANYDVSLMLYHHKGEFLKYIPKKVNLLPQEQNYTVFEVPIKSLLFNTRFKYAIARILAKLELSFYCMLTKKRKNTWINQQYAHKYVMPLLPKIKGEYDLAINFLGVPDILLKKVNAKVKAGWIHTDYDQLVANEKMDNNLYAQLDYIVNVSDETNRVFLKHYPQFKEKAIVIENMLSSSFIREQAEEFEVEKDMPMITGSRRLLSIGRFGYAKNFDNIPEICKMILEKGIDIRWYIIGYGNDKDLIKSKITQFGMHEHVIILGKKENPYPYIKACDIYVQPSRYEGKAVTVREAQILHKPVIITSYETAVSQLKDGVDGVIVPMENEGCANGIAKIILKETFTQKIINGTRQINLDSKAEIEKINTMLKNKGKKE